MDVTDIYRFGDAVLDTRAARLTRSGRPLELEPRAFDVLRYLVQNRGRLVTHQELIDGIWRDTHVTAHSLTQAVSQLRRALDDDSRRPRFIRTVHRRGYEFVARVTCEKPAESRTTKRRWSVRTPLIRLIGREDLVDCAVREVKQERLVTLVGPGGVGKTQLALEVGRRLADRFADGILFIDLTAEVDAAGVARAISWELRVDPGEVSTPYSTVAEALRDRSALLLFDNCEHLVGPVGSFALAIQTHCPGVHILVTTQRHLSVAGQRLLKVPPLDLPEPGWTPGGDERDWPSSVRLFVERAQAVNPDFTLTGANASAVVEICRRLDGVALAVELAAARANVFSAEQIAARLGERFELLTAQHPAALSRHTSLDATISWSVSLLSEDGRRALEHLSVFSGGWDLTAAEAVLDLQEAGVIDALSSLVDKSLVTLDIGRAVARYSLLDSIRIHSRERLLELREYAVLRDRHLTHYGRFAAEVERSINEDPRRWLARVHEEHANLRDALAWATANPATAEEGVRLCCNLRWAWRLEGNYVESREWLQQALASATQASPSVVGKAWVVLGLIHHHRGEFAQALEALETGLVLLPPQERRERAFGVMLRAHIELLAGSRETSDAIATSIEPEIEALDDNRLAGFALMRRGMAAGLDGQSREAVPLLERALDRLSLGGDPFLLIFTRIQLALQRFLAGDFTGARAATVLAIREASELDNLRAIAGPIEICAYLSLQEDDVRSSARLLGAAGRLREITAAPLLSNFSPAHARALAAVSTRLGPSAARKEMAAGAQAPVEEIIASLLAVTPVRG
jgi:predicted ATPase/DNA-binding winged helix-turn-helix (wHTH) protein